MINWCKNLKLRVKWVLKVFLIVWLDYMGFFSVVEKRVVVNFKYGEKFKLIGYIIEMCVM